MDLKEKIFNDFKSELNQWKLKSYKYVNDKKKAKDLLNKAIDKAMESEMLLEVFNKLKLFFNIIRDWSNGTYKEIPTGSIVMIIMSLVYFVSPIDLIPDFIIGIGLFDDAIVIGYVFKQVIRDLEKYSEWKKIN